MYLPKRCGDDTNKWVDYALCSLIVGALIGLVVVIIFC